MSGNRPEKRRADRTGPPVPRYTGKPAGPPCGETPRFSCNALWRNGFGKRNGWIQRHRVCTRASRHRVCTRASRHRVCTRASRHRVRTKADRHRVCPVHRGVSARVLRGRGHLRADRLQHAGEYRSHSGRPGGGHEGASGWRVYGVSVREGRNPDPVGGIAYLFRGRPKHGGSFRRHGYPVPGRKKRGDGGVRNRPAGGCFPVRFTDRPLTAPAGL